MELTSQAPIPRPAATVVPLRDSPTGLEVLLTRRPENMRFMGGAIVFPGGAVAPADLDPRWEDASALDADDAADALGSTDPQSALGSYVCALREGFEEVGLLLASGPVGELRRDDASDPARFLSRCLDLGIVLATDALVPAGRWVTPLGAPVRFDARFFVTPTPVGWEPEPDPHEVADCRWASPARALTELAAGRMIMAPPTVEMLQHLDAFATTEEALAAMRAARGRSDARILTTRLSPVVAAVLAPNPGAMTGPGTNTYVVGSGPTAVIDPAVDDEAFVDAVLVAAREVTEILITHRHPDHVGGVAELSQRTGAPVRAFGREPIDGIDVMPLADGDRIDLPGARLVTIHAPGHASDHVCFLMDGAASLFAGDNILGEGTAVIAPPDGDMRAYLGSLRRLAGLGVDRIYPGHWRPLDGGTAVIEGYIAHRVERERMIFEAVSGGAETIDEIVATVYADTPAALHPVAAYQVRAHLEMLADAGRVVHDQERWSRVDVD